MSKRNSQKTPWNRSKRKETGFLYLFGLFFLIAVPGYFMFIIGRGMISRHLLKSSGVVTHAIVINEKNYYGNGHINPTFSYSYEFLVNGQGYKGDTRDPDCGVGQRIKIKYVPAYPKFSVKVENK